jgi:hypothetical protein
LHPSAYGISALLSGWRTRPADRGGLRRSRHRSRPSHETPRATGESALHSCPPVRFAPVRVHCRFSLPVPDPGPEHPDASGSGIAARRTAGRPLPSIPPPLRPGHAQASFAAPCLAPPCGRRLRAIPLRPPATPAPAPWRFARPDDESRAARPPASHDGGTPPPIRAAAGAARSKAPPPAARRSSAMSRGIGRPSGVL